MALQKQTFSINVAEGLDTKTDPKQVLPGKALALENVRFQKTGKLSKAFGYTQLSDDSNIGSVSANVITDIVADEEYLAAVTESGTFGYSVGDGKWYLQNKLGVTSRISTDFVMKNYFEQKGVDMDITADGSHRAYVCRQEKGLTFTQNILIVLEDSATGAKKAANVLLAGTNIGLQRIICVESGGSVYVHVFYYSGSDVLRNIYDENLVAISSGVSIVSAGDQSQFDVCKSSDRIYFARITGTAMELRSYDFEGVQQATASVTNTRAIRLSASLSARGLNINFIGSVLHVAWINTGGNGASIRGFNSSLSQIVSELDFFGNQTRISVCQAEVGLVVLTDTDLSGTSTITTGTLTFTTTYSYTAGINVSRAVLSSNVFLVGNKNFVIVRDKENINKNFYLWNISDSYIAQSFSPALAIEDITATVAQGAMLSKVIVQNGVAYAAILRRVRSGSNDFGETFSTGGMSLNVHDFNTDFRDGCRSKIGKTIYLTKGATIEMDKAHPHDNGFTFGPEIASVTATPGTGTPSVASKTFAYKVVYEYYDSASQVSRSIPSETVQVTTAANTASVAVVFRVPLLNFKSDATTTDFSSLVNVAIYRTTTGPGSVFYKIFDFYTVKNDGTTSQYDDIADDSSIINNEALYTTGGVLENNPAPTARFSTSGGNRLFLGGLEESDEIAFSKKQLFGESVAFNDLFRIRVSSGTSADKSKISALGYMDGKLIIFREGSIYFVQGDGPTETGQGGFSDPEVISSDAGCTEPRSVINIPNGLMFKSRKGIYLLNRGLSVEYIGAAVEDFNLETIVASSLKDDANEVRFYTDQGNALVYNYLFGAWSVLTDQTDMDADTWRNNPVMIVDGRVSEETDSVFTRNGDYYAMKFTSPWLKLDLVQGFIRVYRLHIIGDYKSAHTLKCRVYTNYNDSVFEEYELVYNNTDSPQYQFQIHMKDQKVESIKFEIFDDDHVALSSGEAYDLSNIQCEIGVKGGGFRLADSKSY